MNKIKRTIVDWVFTLYFIDKDGKANSSVEHSAVKPKVAEIKEACAKSGLKFLSIENLHQSENGTTYEMPLEVFLRYATPTAGSEQNLTKIKKGE